MIEKNWWWVCVFIITYHKSEKLLKLVHGEQSYPQNSLT